MPQPVNGVRASAIAAISTIVVLALGQAGVSGQSSTAKGEWPTYGGDLRHTRYSPLDQINAANFNKLEVAWRFKTDNLGPAPEFKLESTPLMVNGVVYSTGGTRRAVVALDAATGEMLWMHSEQEGARAAASPRPISGRGLTYWSDGRDARIFYVTVGYQLVALDARTGARVPGFGQQGLVDLKKEFDQQVDPIQGDVGLASTPIVANDVVIVGAAHSAGGFPRSKTNVKGYVRAFDARTGKRLWVFHTIPSPGEFGNQTWEKDSWSYTGNTGVWAQISVDTEAGLAYLPVEEPTGDDYGGHRPGNNLFGESLVAVDLKTGQRRWHFQLVHHPIWDMDIPCAPILADVPIDGRLRKIVAQPTKQSFLYVFDRITGEPIWPIEERPVPQSDVPGEKTSRTQPFPTKPPAYGRQGSSFDDLIDFTPALREEAVKLVSKYKLGPIFTPPVVSKADGPIAILTAVKNGTTWEGGSYDPETHILYVPSQEDLDALALVPPDPARSDMAFVRGFAVNRGAAALTIQGLPLAKPPYQKISAIDMTQGRILWQIAHGDSPDSVRNHPLLKGLNVPRTGRQGDVAALVTKTLLIVGEGDYATTPAGQRGAMLRAYDKASGKDAGAVYMPAPQTGSPMTYMHQGKQYIVVAISGGTYSGELLAFKLGN